MTHAMKIQKQHTAGWYGRSSGNSASIYCALNGWREAVWKRDPRRRWYEASTTTTEQVFTGFLALPAPMVVDDWRSALGDPKTMAEAEGQFRERIKRAHIDAGGSSAAMAVLTAAIARAREALQ